MSTKSIIRDMNKALVHEDFSLEPYYTCIECDGKFRIDRMSLWWRARFGHLVCPWCASRGWRKLRISLMALDKIANTPCLKGTDGFERRYEWDIQFGLVVQETTCKCISCYAGRVFDQLVPETVDASAIEAARPIRRR